MSRFAGLLGTLLFLTVPARAESGGSESAYQGARTAYHALKRDPARRKFRHHWLNVTHKFEAVSGKYPGSPRAADALFTAASLMEELSRISMLPEDLQAAVADYRKLCARFPRHHLADDAALALAHIELDRLGRPEEARQVIKRAIVQTPKGDRIRELKSLLTSVIREEEAKKRSGPKSAPLGARVVASEPKRAIERLKGIARKEGAGEYTLSQQLGLKVRRVIVDAGHGGRDTGAIGRSGTQEKEVSLAIARRLGEILTGRGLEVILTRDQDVFVPLEARAQMANEAKGDLFISIHCNSSARKALHGIETYTLNTASDRYSIRLAARENASSEKRISDLQFILADLATKANTEESSRLASAIQQSMVERLRARYADVRGLGTKQALFYVLLGVKMPSILVESSFLSNPEEEKRLRTRTYQFQIAEAIAAGVQDFLGNRQRVARVD